jgi:hypothetical protein
MSKDDKIAEWFKFHDDLLKITKTPTQPPVIKERAFLLDYLVLEKRGIFGYIIPIFLSILFIILGFAAGIYPSPLHRGVSAAAQGSYTFWVIFLLLGTYLLDWLVLAINKVVQEANKRLDLSEEKHNRILDIMFGPKGVIAIILIALPFILYDITGFGSSTEGWLTDVAASRKAGDNSWYPGLTQTPNGIGFGSVLWLVIWIIPWFYFSSFTWLSLIFLYYMNVTLKGAEYRAGIQQVIREKQFKRLLNHSIEVYAPLMPYIVTKLIFQIFYDPWWSDTIATYLVFSIFFIGVGITPFLITSDLKAEKQKLLEKLQELGNRFFDDTVRSVFKGEKVETSTLITAIILHLHDEEVIDALGKKVIDSNLLKKILFALIAPVVSLIAKVALGGALTI